MKGFTWFIAIVFNVAKFFIRTWTIIIWLLARLGSSFLFLADTSVRDLGTVRAHSTSYWKLKWVLILQKNIKLENCIYNPQTYHFCKPCLLSRILHLHTPPYTLSCLVWYRSSRQLWKTPYKLFLVSCWNSQSWKYKLLRYKQNKLNKFKNIS